MTFTVTKNEDGRPAALGHLKVVTGAFTNTGGDTGGTVDTNLREVLAFVAQYSGTPVSASAAVTEESFPISGGDVTLVTEADKDGVFIAIGR